MNRLMIEPTKTAFLGITTTTCGLSSPTTGAPLKDDRLMIEPLGVEVNKSGQLCALLTSETN
jgi:hypothetical protein